VYRAKVLDSFRLRVGCAVLLGTAVQHALHMDCDQSASMVLAVASLLEAQQQQPVDTPGAVDMPAGRVRAQGSLAACTRLQAHVNWQNC
jgi:hypothetical protein